MADKVEKPKKSKAKAKKDEKGVLAALPSTRPERIGTRRTAAKSTPAATTPAAAKTSAATASKSSSRPTAARRKAAAPRTFEPTEAAESAAGAADERAAGIKTRPRPAAPRPRPVREGAPGIGTPSPDRSEAEAAETGRPSGVELVTTAVQAAGELTQIGLTIGGRIVKRAVDKLPKP
jgi:hypothetical protein